MSGGGVEEEVHYSSDSSSEMDDGGSVTQLALGGDAAGTAATSSSKNSWFKRRLAAPAANKLSIQSGDIVRSPSGSGHSSPVDHLAPSTNGAFVSSQTEMNVPGDDQLESETAAARPDPTVNPPSSMPSKGALYGCLFPRLGYIIKICFYSIRVNDTFSLPVVSAGILLLNLLTILVMVVGVVFSSWRPKINVSIEAFGIPDHPAQLHWDAYSAAESNNFVNISLPAENANSQSFSQDNVRRRRSSQQPGDCPPIPHKTQTIIHRNWELDLVFRVPSPASKVDDNILTRERISRIHEIEETIYNSSGYGNVCRRSNSFHCYPLSSLLSWLYLRDQNTGQYVFNTPDGFTPDLQHSLQQLSNLSVALWFTGGQAKFSSDFSYVEAKLLRSQVRVALPFPCFANERDRYDQQKQVVTDYFVSLIPFLDQQSSSDVEVLYGGSIIFDYQVTAAIYHDAVLASISLCLVAALMFVLSGFSPWLTIAGLYAIVSCFIPAYLVYRGIFQIETIGLLNVVSIFVVIGIGVDDVFVFINTYKHSAKLSGLHGAHDRITHTVLEATKATFFTSLTTSIAFLANVISSIPAVRQFGIFMGLVVLFCFIQVLLVIPHSLYVWECIFLPMENYVYFLPFRKRKTYSTLRDNVGSVRMSNLVHGEDEEDQDDDSGINSVSSNSDNASNDSSQSNDATIEMDGGDTDALIVQDAAPRTVEVVAVVVTLAECNTIEQKLTLLMQKCMLYLSVVPMALHLVFSKLRAQARARRNKMSAIAWWLVHIGVSVAILGGIWVLSVGLLSQLRLTNQPPQFFPADSNIQKMLNLVGNVTNSEDMECYDQCSAWGRGSDNTIYVPPPPLVTDRRTPGTKATPLPTSPVIHSTTSSSPPPPSTTARPTHHTNRPATTATTSLARTTQSVATHPPTKSTPGTSSRSTGSASAASTTPVPPPTSGTTGSIVRPPTNTVTSVKFSSNAAVHVVFGISGVDRSYDTSHVLPEDGDKQEAVLDPSFISLFTCNNNARARNDQLKGALRAMCRICANVSNPANGLTLEGNYQCFPSLHANQDYFELFSCLLSVVNDADMPECANLVLPDSSNVSVSAKANATRLDENRVALRYLAMAFKSTTNPGASPFDAIKDYHKWDKFLKSELDAILSKSSKGDRYEGAQAIASAFQTSELWQEVNVQIVAVYGSLYGILISFVLCSIVVVVLAHDLRIVISMVVTIATILVTLGGLFWCFGWKLGIVEAISLSILVGNSLDYCIHLSEGFVAMDTRHVAFVERFSFVAHASPRVKRVMAAISFIGVSILSSAVTTILAILPLVGTHIQLFTRFGEILLLDTAVAIIYTFIICGNCLAFFGPPVTEKTQKKILNAVLTIAITIAIYILVIVALYIASRTGVYIPSPQGGELFK